LLLKAWLSEQCRPKSDNEEWLFTFGYNECQIKLSEIEINPLDNGVDFNTFTAFLNFDAHLEGSGSIMQIGQTKIACRIPRNLQENGHLVRVTTNLLIILKINFFIHFGHKTN
jgi:hypothetical protein